MKTHEKTKRAVAFIVSVMAFVIVVIAVFLYFKVLEFPRRETFFNPASGCDVENTSKKNEGDISSAENAEEGQLPENPINFSEQMALNDEIYAWIKIPNTNVDYPILQSREDDLYYMRRNIDKTYYISGVIFTQSANKKDFKDSVTVIYGHNMTNDGSMFATLHNFEDKTFFDENEYFYIYTPGHILTYRVVSAYKYDNRHIMNSFDFGNSETVREYFDYVTHPTMIPMNVREGAELKDDDKLVVLSTCMADNTYRYLVNGVLVRDDATR